MKKYISKILLLLSVVFGIVTIYELIHYIQWTAEGLSAMLASLAVCGLFLALYRIIDLLEK